MARFDELNHRRRVVRGPLADLVELDDGAGGRFVALCHHDGVRAHPALGPGLESIRDFLELPMIEGLCRLEGARNGVFVYATPDSPRTARELVAVFAEEGGAGERAALELLARAATILVSAAEAGTDRGVMSHGSLDPWRLLVAADGSVSILGYGLPSLDGVAFQQDERQVPRPDSLRYFPPERLDGEPELVTSDLFVACLVAAELCSGLPVYSGADLLDQVSAGEAADRLGTLPRGLSALLAPMLAPFPEKRPRPRAWIRQLEDAIRRAPGRSLAQLVADGAAYLSDVEEDLPVEVPFTDLLGPEPEDPRLAALRDAVAEALEAARDELAGAPADPPMVDDPAPAVVAAAAAVDASAAALRALEVEVEGLAAEVAGAVDEAEVALHAARALAERCRAARERDRAARAAVVDAVAAEAEAREHRRRQLAEDAQRAVTEAEEALEAFGEDEDAETSLGAARAALRKAQGMRDRQAAGRQLERAVQAARQVHDRLHAARAERAAREEGVVALRAELAGELARATSGGTPTDDLADVATIDGPDAAAAWRDALARRVDEHARARLAALATARQAVVDAARDPGQREDGDQELTTALEAAVARAAVADDLAELEGLRREAAAAVHQLAEQRRARAEARRLRRTALVDALAAAAERGRRAAAAEVDDAAVAAALGALERATTLPDGAPEPALEAAAAAAPALADAVESAATASRATRQAGLDEARQRVAAAHARARAAAEQRDEPELQLYAAEAAGAAQQATSEVDLEAAAQLALRAEAAADAAEQLLAEVRAEEEAVLVARLRAIGQLGRKVEARARRLGDDDLVSAVVGRVAALATTRDVAWAEAEVAAVSQLADAVEARLAAERAALQARLEAEHAAAEQARVARAEARREAATALLAQVEAIGASHDDAVAHRAVRDARQAVAGLGPQCGDDEGEARLQRVREALRQATAAAEAAAAAAEARAQAARAARQAELAELHRAARELRATAPVSDDPEASVLAESLRTHVAEVEASAEPEGARRHLLEAQQASSRLHDHVRAQEERRRREQDAARVAARVALEASLAAAAVPADPPEVTALLDEARARLAEVPSTAEASRLHALAGQIADAVRAAAHLRAQLAAARAERDAREAEVAARAHARDRLQAAVEVAATPGEHDDDPAVAGALAEVLTTVASLPDDAPSHDVLAAVTRVEDLARDAARARVAARELAEVTARAREADAAQVAELRAAAGRIATTMVETTLQHDDAALVFLLSDTEEALDALQQVTAPAEALALLRRVEGNAREAVEAQDRLEGDRARRERDEAARAVRLLLDDALQELDPVLDVLGPLGTELLVTRSSVASRARAHDDPEVLRGLLDEARALERAAHSLVGVRAEQERRSRDEARRLAHEAVQRAHAAPWLSKRSDLVDRVLLVRAAIEQQLPDDALEAARALAGQVDALDAVARADARRDRAAAVLAAAAHLASELPQAPEDGPPELWAELAALRADVAAFAPGELPDDADAADAALDGWDRRAQALGERAAELTRQLGGWRSERIGHAVERARAASARAWAAWREAQSVRDDEGVRGSVDEAEQACALVAGATDPGDADWNAALAVAAADRAEEGVATLQDEVRQAIAVLTTLQLVRDDVENELLSWANPASAGPEAELHQLWTRAEQAARRAERARVEAIGVELRALADRVKDGAPTGRDVTPAPAMSLAERIQLAQRGAAHGGHAVLAGPTLSPDDTDVSGPTFHGRRAPKPPTPLPSIARPTLAPESEDDNPTVVNALGETPGSASRRPSVSDLQARLRARAASRTPPSGLPAPGVSEPPRDLPRSGNTPTPSRAPGSAAASSVPPSPRTGPVPSLDGPVTGPQPAVTSPTQRIRPADVPTAPRPIPRPPNAPLGTPPRGTNPAAEARTTLMNRTEVQKVLAAALAEDVDPEDPDGGRTTVFRPSDYGVDDEDPPEGY
jgi:hypothetical protein